MAASEVEHEESALLLRCPAAEPVVGSHGPGSTVPPASASRRT